MGGEGAGGVNPHDQLWPERQGAFLIEAGGMDDLHGWEGDGGGTIYAQHCFLAVVANPTVSSPIPASTCHRRGLLSPSVQERARALRKC